MASQSITIRIGQCTEAPWFVDRGQKPPNRLSVYGARGSSLCTIWTHDDDAAWANAHLIRTAPELYRTIAEARERFGPDEAIDELLKKARGEWRP